jgi:hypothetical protein
MSPRFPTPSTSLRNKTFMPRMSALAFRADNLGLGGHCHVFAGAIGSDSIGSDSLGTSYRFARRTGDSIASGSRRTARRPSLLLIGVRTWPTPTGSALTATEATVTIAPAAPAAPATRSFGGGPLRVGQQHELTSGLDGEGDVALVLSTVTRHPTSPDLSPVAHVLAEHVDVFVVNPGDPVLADGTRLLLDAAAGVLGGTAGIAVTTASTIVIARHD